VIYGLYTAASGAFVEDAKADMTANNLANINTPGFRRDFMSFQSRGPESQEMDSTPDFAYANDVLDTLGGGVVLHRVSHDLGAGEMQQTKRKLDFALTGEGYFEVDRAGKRLYTRAGNFTVDSQGRLVTADGKGTVLGAGGGEIVLDDPENTAVTKDGRFIRGVEEVGQLAVVRFADPAALRKVGDAEFDTDQEALAFDGKVEQGILERSSVNPVTEMVNMIRGFRAYEADLSVVKSIDSTLDRVANSVARVPA